MQQLELQSGLPSWQKERAAFLNKGTEYHSNSEMLLRGKDAAYSLVKPGWAWLSLCSLVFYSICLKEGLMWNPEKPRNSKRLHDTLTKSMQMWVWAQALITGFKTSALQIFMIWTRTPVHGQCLRPCLWPVWLGILDWLANASAYPELTGKHLVLWV